MCVSARSGKASIKMEDFTPIAHRLADISRTIVPRYFRTNIAVLDKQDDSPVTAGDRAVETEIREALARLAPEQGIIGEEFPNSRENADYVWVIDPIDGTKAFICGIPVFTTLIALLYQGKPILGVIDQPFTRERWWGGNGIPSQYRHQDKTPISIHTSSLSELPDAWFACTEPLMFDATELVTFNKLQSACKHVRYGTDGYGYAMTAMGNIHGVMESSLNLYDYVAPAAVLEGAGGICTDWQGNTISIQTGKQIIATANPALHEKVLCHIHR